MRVITVVFGVGILTMSQCWAHGHSPSFEPPLPRTQTVPAEPSAPKPFHDWLQPDDHNQKNPYDKMSCPELYTLATQGDQNADMARAFEDKDCHAL